MEHQSKNRMIIVRSFVDFNCTRIQFLGLVISALRWKDKKARSVLHFVVILRRQEVTR